MHAYIYICICKYVYMYLYIYDKYIYIYDKYIYIFIYIYVINIVKPGSAAIFGVCLNIASMRQNWGFSLYIYDNYTLCRLIRSYSFLYFHIFSPYVLLFSQYMRVYMKLFLFIINMT